MFITATLAFACGILPAQPPVGLPSYDVTLYTVGGAHGISAGPDGAIWFTETGKIGGMSMSGAIMEFALPSASGGPLIITAGADGALWFTENSGNKIGRITTNGAITEFTIPTANAQPFGIAAGPDGALWFTEIGGNKIGRITTTGAFTEYPLPSAGSVPSSIAAGPDGALWFGEEGINKIGRITTAGVITEYSIPTNDAAPRGITAGPDGAVWFTEARGNKIGRLTMSGTFTEWPCGAEPFYITSGPDGAMWFGEKTARKIGRLTTAGALTEIVLSTAAGPIGIATGLDGAIWFAADKQIGRVQLPKSRTGVLSHIAAGGAWTTEIALVNTSPAAVPVTVRLRDDEGGLMSLPLAVTQQGAQQSVTASSVDAVIHPNATLLISMGPGLASTLTGWAEVLSAGPVCGYAIFRSDSPGGAASEGTAPLQTQFPAAIMLSYNNTGGFAMGVAIANLSSSPAAITATLFDENGNQLGVQTIPVGGNGHTSFVLPTQFALASGRRGMVRFQSAGGLAGLGLRFSPSNTFTSVPTM